MVYSAPKVNGEVAQSAEQRIHKPSVVGSSPTLATLHKSHHGDLLMHTTLWVLQIILGLYFMTLGIMHFIRPPNLPQLMSWFYELSPMLHYFSGSAEILGSLGLILPGLTKVQTRLTPLASIGLALLMVGAAGYHIIRGEIQNLPTNIVLFSIASYIAYGRWNKHPLPDSKK